MVMWHFAASIEFMLTGVGIGENAPHVSVCQALRQRGYIRSESNGRKIRGI